MARYEYDEDNLVESVKYDPDGTAGNGDEFELDLLNNALNGLLTGTEMKDDTSPTPVVKVSDAYKYFNDGLSPPETEGYGEVYEYKATVTGNGELFKTVFERDKLGRIKKKTETLNGSSTPHVYEYTYYPEGMLKTVTVDSGTPTTYRYNANFNRLNIDGGTTNDAEYDIQDRLESYAGNTYS